MRSTVKVLFSLGLFLLLLIVLAAWTGAKASVIQQELQRSNILIAHLQQAVLDNNPDLAAQKVDALQESTKAARKASEDPVWVLASAMPWIGPNVSAISEVARSADDVATLGLKPLVEVLGTIDWSTLMPSGSEADLSSIEQAGPRLAAAAHAVSASASRLEGIETGGLLGEIAEPLVDARNQLRTAGKTLTAAGDAAGIAAKMMGSSEPRRYLLLIQNNAEVRASGGIPTALAVLTLDKGKMEMSGQTTANALGRMQVPVGVESEQETIYSTRIGTFMQDVNLTPDFPTAATTASNIWRKKTGQTVDGVLSVDPVALSYILDTTGPVTLSNEAISAVSPRLPSELNGDNVVKVLMSDAYSAIPDPAHQDLFFAAVAKEVFSTLAAGSDDPTGLFEGIKRGVDGQRILLWSAHAEEQRTVEKYPVGGSVSRESIPAAQYGVYFNDGTGAKMDYYVKRTVQLIKECPRDGYEQTTVRVTSTNTAPADAATSLPEYVTGGGTFGVPAGSVETNVIAYGPVQANVETAKVDGQQTGFAPYLHSNRPVGVLAIRLAPGESRTVDFTFGKIVQHTEPNVVVTPGVQDVKDVTLPTADALCD